MIPNQHGSPLLRNVCNACECLPVIVAKVKAPDLGNNVITIDLEEVTDQDDSKGEVEEAKDQIWTEAG